MLMNRDAPPLPPLQQQQQQQNTPADSEVSQAAAIIISPDVAKEAAEMPSKRGGLRSALVPPARQVWLRKEMEIEHQVNHMARCCSSSPISEGSAMDRDPSFSSANSNRQPRANSPPLLGRCAQHSDNSAAYFLWPPVYQLHGSAEERTTYFYGLQKDVDLELIERVPSGPQAATLLDVMTIRAYHSKRLRRVSLGTAVGFRTRQGIMTHVPAIIVFVARKVHQAWLQQGQILPMHLEGPGGVWCDVDVVEFSYYGAPTVTPKEQVYTELAEGLRGNDPSIGPGSQVASQETYGTLGAIVQSKTGSRQIGFLTNRHVAVDLDYPNQKMFHPLPPSIGPGVYLGAVERATSFITDERWYHIFASVNPETFVRADGAFIPFGDSFDLSRVTTTVRGVGEMGDVMAIDLQAPIGSIVGKQVVKVGRSSGLTKGSIMAYALEYNDEKGICFFTDFIIVGENKRVFDLEGDSGSLILMVDECFEKPKPVGIIWGGTSNRGRLKLQNGHGPESWTSAVDLGRLLECLQLDLITSDPALEYAIEKQRLLTIRTPSLGEASSRPVGTHHSVGEVPQQHVANESRKLKQRQNNQWAHGHLGYMEELGRVELNHDLPLANASNLTAEPFDFMKDLDLGSRNPERNAIQDLSVLKKFSSEDVSFGLHLYDRDAKRRWL